MYSFISHQDELGKSINTACQNLFTQIQALNIEALPFEPFFRQYFIKCHLTRPYFSLKTSAKLLYEGITATGKHYKDVIVMDYGAGLGTLYIIAKMIGVKKIIYNDLLPEFAMPAIEVDKVLGHIMDEYIIGDTEDTCKQLAAKNIICDVIVSRNVVEHIYDLKDYFSIIHRYQPRAILYNSTTANWNNPAAHIQHIFLHKKYRPTVVAQKINIIKTKIPTITTEDANQLAMCLVQYGGIEFENAIEEFASTKKFPTPKNDYTNVCDENGTWSEHLINFSDYKKMATQYDVTFKPGFWDEDYKSFAKRMLGKTLNIVTNILGNAGVVSTSFIYVIAKPKQ